MTEKILWTNDLFCGAGGMGLGFKNAGFRLAGAWDFDKYAVESYGHNISPKVKQADITQMKWDDLPKADVWTFGFPCFPKGTLILCKDGMKDISEVKEGDYVLTHKNRWRKVVQTMHRTSPTWLLKGHGHPEMVTTDEHPFWASSYERKWNSSRKSYDRLFKEPDWIKAEDMKGKYWSSPVEFPESEAPNFELVLSGNYTRGPKEQMPCEITNEFFWIVGAWLGDGWLKYKQREGRPEGQLTGQTFICANKKEADELEQRIVEAGLNFTRTEERTTTRFIISSRPLARWLLSNFGQYSDGKNLPTWVYGMSEEFRKSLFDGYRWADGSFTQGRIKITSINKGLIIGMKLLAQTLGYSVALHIHYPKRKAIIEGREVSEKPQWQLVAEDKARSSVVIGGHRFGLVRYCEPTGKESEVFNFEVEEDNSYVADGLTVHNCQDLSVAGKQAGMKLKCLDCGHEFKVLKDGETNCPECGSDNTKAASRSGLFFEVMRLLDETIENEPDRLPNIIMAENVKGLKPYLGVLKDEYHKRGYRMTYTLYNSKYWGVPQNRERYFVVGIRETIRKAFQFPRQQTDFIPKLSSVLESEVDEKYYIDDLKAAKIIEQAVNGLKVKQATKKGYDIAVEGDSINISHPNSQTRRGRVGKQVAQTLLTGQEQVVVESSILRPERTKYGKEIRKQYEAGEIEEKWANLRELKPRPDGISNTLTSVQKDNLLLETLGDVHACITPDRADKKQNGRRAKNNEEEMFTLTAQDLHGVIIDNKQVDKGRVYSDTAPTILANDYKEPKLTIEQQPEINMLGLLDIKGKDQIRRVYDPEGISPTLTAVQGGGHEAKILVESVDEPHLKFVGGIGEPRLKDGKELSRNYHEKHRVYDAEGISPCVPADIATQPKILTLGNTNPSGKGMNGNVFDSEGLAPTLTTNKGEGVKVMVKEDKQNGDAYEGNSDKTLQVLRSSDGTEEAQEWQINESLTLRQADLLQSEMHAESIRGGESQGCKLEHITQKSNEDKESGNMRDLWKFEECGSPSQGRELAKQQSGESSSSLSELPHENTQAEEKMQNLRTATQGSGVLQQTLSSVQEVRRSELHEVRYRVRKLSPREYARLQGFPDTYEQVVSNSQFYKQMGNAVTVNVAQAIAEKIKEFLEKI